MRAGLFGLRGSVALVHAHACPRAYALYRRFPHVQVLPLGVSMVVAAPRVPFGYTADELDRDNPFNAWMYP